MKIISRPLFVVLLLVAGISVNAIGQGKVWLNYTDTANNITVSYPETWTLKTTSEKAIFILTSPEESDTDKFRENINMIVRPLPANSDDIKVNDIAGAIEAKIPTLVDNFVEYYFKDIKWNGSDAKEVSYGGNSKTTGTAVNFIQRITINRGRMILSTYTGEGIKEDVFKSTAVEIINRISFN